MTMNFVDCHYKGRPDLELAPVPFNKLLILILYFYSGDEYFLSSIMSWDDPAIERNVVGLIKDEPCIIAKSLLW